MDYEKMNKEAVELAQAIVKLTSAGWACIAPDSEQKPVQVCSTIEDEIKNALLYGVATVKSALYPGAHFTVKEALAWLDEQKENKAKMPMWRKIKKGEHLPEPAYLWKLAYDLDKNFMGKCHIDGFLIPNIACEVGCDTWYLPIADIKNLPKEE